MGFFLVVGAGDFPNPSNPLLLLVIGIDSVSLALPLHL